MPRTCQSPLYRPSPPIGQLRLDISINQSNKSSIDSRNRPSNSDTGKSQSQWTKLWLAKVRAKVRSFARRLVKNSIPTGETLKRRSISKDDVCVICNASAWHHALLDCHMSKCVWALMEEELVEHIIACNSDDAKLWRVNLQDSSSEKDFAKLLVTLWVIWWARRKVKHEQIFQSPQGYSF